MRATTWVRAVAAGVAVALAAPAWADDVVIWHPYNHEEKTAFDALVTRYNARQGAAAPHVKAVPISLYLLADRVAAAIPRGKGPDLFVYAQDRLGGWIHAGNVLGPLDAVVDAATRERFMPVTLQALTYRGALYGLPFDYKLIAMFYDRKRVPEPPRTTAELAALGRKLTRRAEGLNAVGYLYGDYYYYAALQNGFVRPDAPTSLVLDAPENLAALHLLLRWKEQFLVPDDALTREDLARLFDERKVAIAFEGPWFIGQLRQLGSKVEYAIAPLPAISEAHDQPMRPWMTVEGIYLANGAKQREPALEFMRWLTDLEAQKYMALEGSQLPANQKVYLDPDVQANEYVKAFFRQAHVGVPMPNVPEMTALWTPASVALSTVLRGAETPEVALPKAQAKFTAFVAAMRGQRQ